MMIDWNAYREQVLAGVTRLGRASAGTVRGAFDATASRTESAPAEPT